MPRFVILRHEFPPGDARAAHWDLMFECGGVLRTWATQSEPRAGQDFDAEQLPDHRLVYLDYEGPVSCQRGWVSRWEAGQYAQESVGADHWTVVLDGSRLAGKLSLRQVTPGHSWRVSFAAAPTSGAASSPA